MDNNIDTSTQDGVTASHKVADLLTDIETDLRGQLLRAAESKCLKLLESHRTSQRGWLHLGEVYAQRGMGKAAKMAFTRAWLLDPEARWVDRVFPALENHLDGSVPEELTSLLQIKSVSVAAAILTKNESRSILRCLNSIRDAVDEIVVVDTGSTDGTIDIVRNVPHPNLKLIHHVWNDDFAEARNAGLRQIESAWVLWLDADEYLHEEDIGVVKEMAGLFACLNEPLILRAVILNLLPNQQIFTSYDTSRIFPTRAGLRFWGRIHEQIGGSNGIGERFIRPAVRIRLYHDGYLPEVVLQKEKQARNLRLLKKMAQEEPCNPAVWLFYGRETLLSGDLDTGTELLGKGYELGKKDPEFSRNAEILTWLIQAYLKQNNLSKSEEVCQELIKTHPDYPDGWYYMAYIRANKIQSEIMAMDQDLKKMSATAAIYRGIVSQDGLITDWKATVLKADLARFAGNLTLAQTLYLEVYQRHPEFDFIRKQLELIEQQRASLKQLSFL